MNTPREVAYKLLYSCGEKGAYSNLAFDGFISKSELSPADRKFAAALSYGTLERLVTLDRIIASRSKIAIDKLSPQVKCVLRLGLYQLLYMDTVPDSAAVNESVKLIKRVYRQGAAVGFVNAVLRGFIRDGKMLPKPTDKTDALSLEYSCPRWLIQKWLSEYSEDQVLSILKSSLGRPPVTLRVNTTKCNAQQLADMLSADGYEIRANCYLDNCIDVLSGGSIESTKAYADGLFHVQDVSSQLCCEALELQDTDTLLDVCSAPGGKAFTCAELMHGKGRVVACDLHAKRVSLIEQGAKRLGLDNITAYVNDAKIKNEELPLADKVLCDVVCSGLGVIRRKPEIKYKKPEELCPLPEIQYSILETSSLYVKKGGTLIYSTCTLSKSENEDVVQRFLKEHDCFEAVNVSSCREGMTAPFVTLTPDMYGGDGFFIAKIKRVK